jgi:biopolymer transport protein ExbD
VNLKGKKVILPESETAKAKPVEQITLSVDSNGSYYVGSNRVAESEVTQKLGALIEARPETEVLLNCDKGLPVTYFLKAFDFAKRANAAHVMVATSPRGMKVGTL